MLMKMPIYCPYCEEIFTDEHQDMGNIVFANKICQKLSHKIEIRASIRNNEIVDIIRIPYSPTADIIWYMLAEHLIINFFPDPTISSTSVHLPFFVPDLSDYPKLLAKVKLYLIFS
jgi:hypothetical protein